MLKIEFYDPSGTIDISQAHAPRLASLERKRIGLLSSGKWQVHRILPMLKTLLEEDFPSAQVLSERSFPQGSTFIGTEETAQLVKRSGVDAMIIGNAA
ncbi:MAG: hypothetical protein A3G24_05015 [Betaproteobacteria bacterium RIFCSPLOWO2_12_FULL_62_13]|nr:MAG: hypothetical protein A3G24_05015 [Betaproteobacteria bacterium RIFCSPLOWO2_12_FULL_62_13]